MTNERRELVKALDILRLARKHAINMASTTDGIYTAHLDALVRLIFSDETTSLIGTLDQQSPPTQDASTAAPGGEPQERVCVWLVEYPTDDNMPARWWHPVLGWVLDANKALRLARREDAEALMSGAHFRSDAVATEHVWIGGRIVEAT